MPRLALHLLGSPQVFLNNKEVKFRRRKSLALLAYLVVTGQSHTRDTLAALFWPEHGQSAARAGLRRALSDLNTELGGDCLDADRETIALHCGLDLRLDMHDFQELTASNDLDHLEKAVALYRADFMAGFSLPDCPDFDDWQFFQREALRASFAAALERLSQGYERLGEHDTGIPYARRWVALDPLHEPAQRELMRLYAQAGQRTAALRQYSECERALEEELGVEPQAETKDLHQAILENRLKPPIEEKAGIPDFLKDRPKHNLPVQLTPFIGREKELAEIARLLDDPDVRLLTILGSGGVGKTRLALESAQGQIDIFTNGVFFVSLAALDAVESIVPTIADAVGFSFYEGVEAKQQILKYLEHKTMLLVMDNYEHLLAGVNVVEDILKTAPGVKVLATSRGRLNLGGEQRYLLAGMDFPDPISQEVDPLEGALGFSSVRLFIQCAQRAQTDFNLDKTDLPYVVRICRLLGGVPLAIRLAAAWVELLPLGEIAAEIEKSIDFLETDRSDILERQRSMRAVFDHSWKLLGKNERKAIVGISVFRGGFTREAAQVVSGASLRELMILVDRSLVQRDAQARYFIHELLQHYIIEKSIEEQAGLQGFQDVHSAYYCQKMQRWEDDLMGARQIQAMQEIQKDIENCRAAWKWASDRSLVKNMNQAMDCLFQYYWQSSRIQEGELLFSTQNRNPAEAYEGEELLVRIGVLSRWSYFIVMLGNFNKGLDQIQKNLSLLESPLMQSLDTRAEKALALMMLAWGWMTTDKKLSKDYLDRSIELYQDLGQTWYEAWALGIFGGWFYSSGDYENAKHLFLRSLDFYRKLENPGGKANALGILGLFLARQQEPEGERYLRESMEICQELGNKVGYAENMRMLGEMHYVFTLTEFRLALSLFEEVIDISEDLGYIWEKNWALYSLGFTNMCLGDYEQAFHWFDKGLGLAKQYMWEDLVARGTYELGYVALAQEKHEEALEYFLLFDRSHRQKMQIRNDAIALIGLGALYSKMGNLKKVQSYIFEAMKICVDTGEISILMRAIPSVALFMAKNGEVERAVEMYEMVTSRFKFIVNARYYQDIFEKPVAKAAEELPYDVVFRAKQRGRELDLMKTAKELLAELEAQTTE